MGGRSAEEGSVRDRPPSRARAWHRAGLARAPGLGAPLDPLTPIIVKTSVGEEQVDYLYEHQDEFPGVKIAQVYLRGYPYSSLAAQVLGYTGEISPTS